ncbi:unnamed protein product [Urochloa humidicola]
MTRREASVVTLQGDLAASAGTMVEVINRALDDVQGTSRNMSLDGEIADTCNELFDGASSYRLLYGHKGYG